LLVETNLRSSSYKLSILTNLEERINEWLDEKKVFKVDPLEKMYQRKNHSSSPSLKLSSSLFYRRKKQCLIIKNNASEDGASTVSLEESPLIRSTSALDKNENLVFEADSSLFEKNL